ncbi:MAG: OprO/OprP family phosphate-selective porin [Bacteroidales bacterium]|nr:OprO/OprP family phosphate-selective porin [Bacteroidales bacterium]
MRKTFLRIVTLVLILGMATVASAQKENKREKKTKMKSETEQPVPKKERNFRISDYISVGGFINAQYEYLNQEVSDHDNIQSSIMQIRRARLDLKGSITPKIEFRLQADFANSPKLVDAFVKLKFCRYANLQVGQFKIPFTLENPYAPLDLEFADNAQVISALSGYKDVTGISSYANGREIGAMLYGTLLQFERDGEKYPLLGYSVGVFGGNGINVKTDNMAKDIAGRIEFHPFLKHLVLSGSAYWGRYAISDDLDGLRLRCAGGAEYRDDNLTVRGEYVWGKTGLGHVGADNVLSVRNMDTQGFYVIAGYWFRFGWGSKSNVQQKLRPVLRYDFYQRDVVDNVASIYYSAGIDWWPEKHVQLRLQYTLRQHQHNPCLAHSFLTMLSVKF